MRTPVELSVQMAAPVEAKPDVTPRDGATVSRPFADILAEAEAVQDVVKLSGKANAPGTFAFQDAWNGLCRGVDWMIAGGLRSSPVLRSRLRRIGR
jgi:hypothetical protein